MIEVSRNEQGWHWTLIDAKGRVLALNDAAFKKRSQVLAEITRVKKAMAETGIVERLN